MEERRPIAAAGMAPGAAARPGYNSSASSCLSAGILLPRADPAASGSEQPLCGECAPYTKSKPPRMDIAGSAGGRTAADRVDAVQAAKLKQERQNQLAKAEALARLPPLVVTDDAGCVRLTDQAIHTQHGMPVVMQCLQELHAKFSIRPAQPRTLYDTATGIRSLHLDGNELLWVPPAIGSLRSLTTLNIGYNILTVLPTELCDLECLTTLFLNNNRIELLPERMSELLRLEYLYADHNFMTAAPTAALAGARSLRTFLQHPPGLLVVTRRSFALSRDLAMI